MSDFSPIQNNILSKLKNAKMLRYSELQQKGVPNDLFNYHLQFLVKKGFLSRSEEGYSLADLGIKYAADPFIIKDAESNQAHLFKVNVITVVSRIKDEKLQILNQIRNSNPSFGKISTMGGGVHKGESIDDAAVRNLKVETGLEAELKIVGSQRRILYKENELFSDVIFYITYADIFKGEPVETEFGKNIWVDIDEAIKNESKDFDSLRKVADVLRGIKEGTISTMPFFYIEDIQTI